MPTPIFEPMQAFFKEDEWPITPVEGRPMLRMNFRGTNGRWMCLAQAREEQQEFIFYSVCDVNAPEERRAAMAEFLTRANYGLYLGNFEMDYSDGEIRYKTSIDVEGATLTAPLIKSLVYANVSLMDRYLPGIMSVLYAGTAPLEAIRKIEG
ncbi:MAG TPA: YbjN domain-containing protein [Chloroflexia bacterium]|nr:YbjN domain-containing protein [Chloroflexia bacterium]